MTNSEPRLRVCLGEYDTGWQEPRSSLERARAIAESAKAAGCDLVVFPEMCNTGFTMDSVRYAEPITGSSVTELSSIAKDHGLWIVAGVPLRRGADFVNSAIAFQPDGGIAATYDKQNLFGYAGETSQYSAGSGNSVVTIGGLRFAMFVCFDLRFPEIFRAAGPEVDAFILIANWPKRREHHWNVLTRARAIENQAYVIAVNRLGSADGLDYAGGSLVVDPWGERCDSAGGGGLGTATVSGKVVSETRTQFPIARGACTP